MTTKCMIVATAMTAIIARNSDRLGSTTIQILCKDLLSFVRFQKKRQSGGTVWPA
jgi:uncharacterized membrane-anchored protein YjiN (DUF445 family)